MEAPFKVGQKVIRLINGKRFLKKGGVYTCVSVFMCPECGAWHILVDIPVETGYYICVKDGCRHNILTESFAGGHASNFAPLPEQRERINYVAVSETLRETAVETFITQTN